MATLAPSKRAQRRMDDSEYTHDRHTIRAALDDTCKELEDAIVTNWIVVTERMDPNGERWISQFSGDAGDGCPPIWHRVGLLHHAITMLNQPDEETSS